MGPQAATGWLLVLVEHSGAIGSLMDLDLDMLTDEETGQVQRVFQGEMGDPLLIVGPFASPEQAEAERERIMLLDLTSDQGESEPIFDGYIFPMLASLDGFFGEVAR